MEDRVVPANLVLEVTTLVDEINANDDAQGVFSLRERIIEANGANPTTQHRIFFKNTLWGGTITLDPASGQLPKFEKSIFVDGPANRITIQRDETAQQKHRIFEIGGDSVSTLARLRILHGRADDTDPVSEFGGGVLSRGSLTVISCELRDNFANKGGGGIAAYATNNKSLDVVNCDINGNSATWGGAIYINYNNSVNISNSVVGLNTAGDMGGGIFVVLPTLANQTTSVTISGVDLVGNSAANAGGGIYTEKSAQGGQVSLTLSNNTNVHENRVVNATGKGGGIFFGRGTITFLASPTGPVTIANNNATTGDGMYHVTGTTVVGTTNPPNPDYTYINDQDAEGAG